MLTAVAIRRDVIDPDLFHCDPLGLLVRDSPDEADLLFHYGEPRALLPVLHRGRIVLARWGCRRNESRVLPCTGWTTTGTSAAMRYWCSVGGVAVVVPAYLGFERGAWVKLRGPVRAVLAYDQRGQPHAFIVCKPVETNCDIVTRPALELACGHAP
jgi:hypothetical protein